METDTTIKRNLLRCEQLLAYLCTETQAVPRELQYIDSDEDESAIDHFPPVTRKLPPPKHPALLFGISDNEKALLYFERLICTLYTAGFGDIQFPDMTPPDDAWIYCLLEIHPGDEESVRFTLAIPDRLFHTAFDSMWGCIGKRFYEQQRHLHMCSWRTLAAEDQKLLLQHLYKDDEIFSTLTTWMDANSEE